MIQRQPVQPGLSFGKSSYKPSRRFTKRMIIANNALAWVGIFLTMNQGPESIEAAFPRLVTLLIALFGIYSGVGHLDLRASQPQQPEYGYGGYGGGHGQQPYQQDTFGGPGAGPISRDQ